ncbi:MAG TPA: hypothetical protein VLA12_03645 [Planctomycetaceae bacterium]|nr:hypothetical protein [Planctomycetaceae bacterium]
MKVKVWINISYNISDQFAKWNRTTIIATDIDMMGIEDPVYQRLIAQGTIEASANRSFKLTNISIGSFNTTNFLLFYGREEYIQSEGRAPSVLQRFAGDVRSTSACCGVESVVNRSSLITPSADYMNYSLSDHELVAHLNASNPLPEYDCVGEVRGITVPGGTLIIEKFRFENTYNITSPLTDCTWP